MTMRDLSGALEALPEVLGDVLFAILYGSAAAGTLTPSSDVDLAVMYPAPLTAGEHLELAGELAALFGRDVELLDLHRAGPIVKMQALRYGRPVVVNDEAALHRFAMYTPMEYHDFKLRRRPIEAALEAALLS